MSIFSWTVIFELCHYVFIVGGPSKNGTFYFITHKLKSSQPNLMILVLIKWGEDALSSMVKIINVDQCKVLNIDCSVISGPPGIYMTNHREIDL